MARIAHPRKVFQFIVEVDGIDQFEIQKVTLPEVEIEKVAHGDTNHDIKTPGRITVSDLVIEKLRPLPGVDRWAWNWLKSCQDMQLGGGALAPAIKRRMVIKEMSANGSTTVNRWVYDGVWPTKISQSDFDRMSSDNVIETITFSVDTPDRQ